MIWCSRVDTFSDSILIKKSFPHIASILAALLTLILPAAADTSLFGSIIATWLSSYAETKRATTMNKWWYFSFQILRLQRCLMRGKMASPVSPNKQWISLSKEFAFPLPKQWFGPGWEKPIFCFGVPNRCFGRGKANSLKKEMPIQYWDGLDLGISEASSFSFPVLYSFSVLTFLEAIQYPISISRSSRKIYLQYSVPQNWIYRGSN